MPSKLNEQNVWISLHVYKESCIRGLCFQARCNGFYLSRDVDGDVDLSPRWATKSPYTTSWESRSPYFFLGFDQKEIRGWSRESVRSLLLARFCFLDACWGGTSPLSPGDLAGTTAQPLTQETWAGRCCRGRAEGKQMISPFDLENVPTGSPSYNPSAKVTTLQRGTLHSLWPFPLD